MHYEFNDFVTRKQISADLTDYFGDEIVLLCLKGCAYVVGFRDFLSQSMKLGRQMMQKMKMQQVFSFFLFFFA